MTLGQKQRKFTLMIAELIQYAYSQGYEISLGEAWRPPETAEAYARAGKGIANSLHISRLAVDLNLFRNGTWLQKTEDFRLLGEWWESKGGTWGGRFGDGNHFSLEHGGVK